MRQIPAEISEKGKDKKMIINALLLAFGLVGIPAIICIHTELAYGDHKKNNFDHTPCSEAFRSDALCGTAA